MATIDVGDLENLNLLRQQTASKRMEGQWLLLWDDGDITILFPSKEGAWRIKAIFSSEIDEILSYRWRNCEDVHGFKVSRNLVKGPHGARQYKVRTWCDTIAHLGVPVLLQGVLSDMGGLYNSLPVRAMDYEDGVEEVKDVLSRGGIFQEQSLGRMSATEYRHPWMSAIAWLYQQHSRAQSARRLPGVCLSTDIHVIAVREQVHGREAEQLFITMGLKARWKYDESFSIADWARFKPRQRSLDVSAMRPGALANCYRSFLADPLDAPHAFMGVMLSAAGRSIDDAESRAELHIRMI